MISEFPCAIACHHHVPFLCCSPALLPGLPQNANPGCWQRDSPQSPSPDSDLFPPGGDSSKYLTSYPLWCTLWQDFHSFIVIFNLKPFFVLLFFFFPRQNSYWETQKVKDIILRGRLGCWGLKSLLSSSPDSSCSTKRPRKHFEEGQLSKLSIVSINLLSLFFPPSLPLLSLSHVHKALFLVYSLQTSLWFILKTIFWSFLC